MKDTIKDKLIQIRVTDEEKALITQRAKDNGFYTVSQFIIWLVNKLGK